ncbi:MAG: hypothetical protein ACODAA_06715 [Gemmatimonadota bacterium]
MDFENGARRRIAATTWLVAVAVAAAACGDDPTAPSPMEPSDVERVHEEFTTLRASLVASTDLVGDLGHVRPVLDTLGSPLPPELRGATLEWDEEVGGYLAGERPGAPAGGLRFIVYDRSATSLPEIGFVDVVDTAEADVSSRTVHLLKDEVTRLDYLLEDGAGDVTAAGFVTDGSRRVDFDVTQVTGAGPDGFHLDLDYRFELRDPALTLEVDYDLRGLTTATGTFVATFTDGVDRLTVDLEQGPEQAVGGSVLWNGEERFAITGDDGEPVFLTPDGEDPEPADERAVRGLFEFAFDGIGYLLPYLLFSDPDLADPSGEASVLRPGVG